jgi:hypothetical protein
MPYSLLTYPLSSSPDTRALSRSFSLGYWYRSPHFFSSNLSRIQTLFSGISLHQSKMYTLQFLDLLSLANLGAHFVLF